MMNLQRCGLALAMMFLVVPCVVAQNDAGRKIRDGAVAHGVRGVQMYQRHAQDRSQMLYHQTQAPQPTIQKAETADLVASIKKDLTSADKALAKIKTEHAKEPEVLKLIASIEKHHAKVLAACGAAEAHAKMEKHDHALIGDFSAEMWHELEAGSAETTKLMKLLKIDKLDAPKKATDRKEAIK